MAVVFWAAMGTASAHGDAIQSTSKFHWTLFDAGGNEAGGGADGTPIQCYGPPVKDCFPFDIMVDVNPKQLYSPVNFEVMLDLPSGRHMKFDNFGTSNDLPEDGYPSANFGCKDDRRNQLVKDQSRTF